MWCSPREKGRSGAIGGAIRYRLLGVALNRFGLRHHPPVTANSVSCGIRPASRSFYGTWVGKEVPMVPPVLPRARIPAISSESEV